MSRVGSDLPLGELIRAHFLFSLAIAFGALEHNKVRASLTSLGILFGVASVIAMLAIGKGAEQEILDQMRLLGANNVIIEPLVEQNEGQAVDEEPEREVKRFSPGLTYSDAVAIKATIPVVEAISAEIVLNTSITREGLRRQSELGPAFAICSISRYCVVLYRPL